MDKNRPSFTRRCLYIGIDFLMDQDMLDALVKQIGPVEHAHDIIFVASPRVDAILHRVRFKKGFESRWMTSSVAGRARCIFAGSRMAYLQHMIAVMKEFAIPDPVHEMDISLPEEVTNVQQSLCNAKLQWQKTEFVEKKYGSSTFRFQAPQPHAPILVSWETSDAGSRFVVTRKVPFQFIRALVVNQDGENVTNKRPNSETIESRSNVALAILVLTKMKDLMSTAPSIQSLDRAKKFVAAKLGDGSEQSAEFDDLSTKLKAIFTIAQKKRLSEEQVAATLRSVQSRALHPCGAGASYEAKILQTMVRSTLLQLYFDVHAMHTADKVDDRMMELIKNDEKAKRPALLFGKVHEGWDVGATMVRTKPNANDCNMLREISGR